MAFKLIKITAAISICAVFTGCVSGNSKNSSGWVCDATGIQNYSYSGSKSAYIHLSGYSGGKNYKVQLNEDKTSASGKTGNGTPFTCTKMQ